MKLTLISSAGSGSLWPCLLDCTVAAVTAVSSPDTATLPVAMSMKISMGSEPGYSQVAMVLSFR